MKVYVHGSGHLAKITREYVKSLGYECPWIQAADILWACEDVEDDPYHTINEISDLVRTNPKVLCLVSSQLPVGTIRQLEAWHPDTPFACCPENFKSTDTVAAYRTQARFVIGVRKSGAVRLLQQLFPPPQVISWASIESAELIKHTINAYLGMCIAFINEIGDICKATGADIEEVQLGLRTEPRVSPLAPLRAGDPFGGGHIDRDLKYLRELYRTPLIEAIYESNYSRRR